MDTAKPAATRIVVEYIQQMNPGAVPWLHNLECYLYHKENRPPTPQEYWKEFQSWRRDLNHLPF
jgi:hypothetical protein